MKRAGLREARQNLSALIEEVKHGREIVITDRGKAVARLVPPAAAPRRPFPDRARLRKRMPRLAATLSAAILEDRADRV